MKVNWIKLTNYRNYSNKSVKFSPNTNILIGKNAQGKTNLLEAIFFCAIGKSMRALRENDIIKWGEQNAKIELEVERQFGKCKIEIFFSKASKKTVKINGFPIRKIGELLGELRCVFFAPDELKLIKESPEDRRRFMDIDISQTSKNYFYLLGRYEKIISNKNKLLKEYKDKALAFKRQKKEILKSPDFEDIKRMINVYDTQLAECASKIMVARHNFIIKLAPFAEKAHSFLTSDTENLNISYNGAFELPQELIMSEEKTTEIKDKFLTMYDKNLEHDLIMGYTTVGPHRDDIQVLINDIDVRSFCSQGQQRTAALSLKLAELEIIKHETGEMPILILDDVFSELDARRRMKLLKFCSLTQTFISATDLHERVSNSNTIKVEN